MKQENNDISNPGVTRIPQSTGQLWVRQCVRAAQQLPQPDGHCHFYFSSLSAFAACFSTDIVRGSWKCLKEKCGLWSWGGQGGWEKGWQWKGNGKRISPRTWSPRLRGKKNKSAEQDRQHRETWAVKEMSYKGLRGLSRFCSIQENTDMSKTRLEDKERFVPKPIYIYPVWHSQVELNTVFILIRSNFYINKIIFLRRIFCWFFASLGVKTVQIWAVLVSAAKLIELIECWIPKIYKTFVPHLFCRNLGANRILNWIQSK